MPESMLAILKDKSLFRRQCLINGQWCDADDKSVLAVTNPANEKQLGTVPKCGAAETRRIGHLHVGALFQQPGADRRRHFGIRAGQRLGRDQIGFDQDAQTRAEQQLLAADLPPLRLDETEPDDP